MTTISAVAATSVARTGRFDFTYQHHLPREHQGSPWGYLLSESGEGTINPFKAVQDGDWSSPEARWHLEIYREGTQVVVGGVDVGPGSLTTLLEKLTAFDFTLLVEQEVLSELTKAALAGGYRLVVVTYNGELKTSGNPPPAPTRKETT